MKKALSIVGLVVVLIVIFYAVNAAIYSEKQADTSGYTNGTYGYRCEDGTEFTMSPATDMFSIYLVPASNVERLPETILSKEESESGTLYQGNDISFYAKGETVELVISDTSTTCFPMTTPDEAPFNFGD